MQFTEARPPFVHVPLFTLLFAALLAPGGQAAGTDLPGRSVTNLNEGWEYLEQSTMAAQEAADADGWTPVTLPHCWNVWDTTDLIPGYRRDGSWYRRSLDIPSGERRYVLHFEGAAMKADVYVNRQRAGGHVGGYVGFDVDITPYLRRNASNEILVRVSNAYDPDLIPSQKADYFLFGGLTRDVWLKELPSTYLDQVHVRTPDVTETSASTRVSVALQRHDHDAYDIVARLIEPGGGVIETVDGAVGAAGELTLDFSPTAHPDLWSPESPSLYSVDVELRKSGETVDRVTEVFGYRWFEFQEHGAFYLNGERLLLRGTHRHEEHAGYASAMPNELHRRDMQMMKEMGANFVRLGHYPQDPVVYQAADSLGLLIWDELPWNRGGMGGDAWKANTERLLSEQIAQNYNHPSVIIWSLGNEIYWLPDFPGGDDPEKLNTFLTRLHGLAHELDPDRLTAIRKYYEGSDIVDVFSPSIWAGWYSGVYTKYEAAIRDAQETYPRMLHMEYGGSSHVGRHTETPVDGEGFVDPNQWDEAINQVAVKNIAKNGDWSENYIVDLFDWHLRVSETLPNFTGNAQWAFKDFGTPLRPENDLPFVNQKGLLDRDGRPKDAYYVFKSYWTTSPRFCYIESHTWTERRGPAGEPRDVSVFCNTDSARLLLNGRDLGIREKHIDAFPASGLTWSVPFAEGENELIAVGVVDGRTVARDTLVVTYSFSPHGKAETLHLSSKPLANGHLLIEAQMLDSEDRRVLDYEESVYFSSDGDGELLVNYGTPHRSRRVGMANGRAAIEFAPVPDGSAVISALNQDFKGTYLVLGGERESGVLGFRDEDSAGSNGAAEGVVSAKLDLLTLERERVISAANRYVDEAPITVTASVAKRSAGGRHDFFSEGDYWWPDPENPDGPYVRRDGLTNPDNFVAHRDAMRRLSMIVPSLTSAYLLTRDTEYADQALRHLNAWFVDDATRMNPNLLYAQAIKGRVTGRGIGIIDTIHLVEVAQAVSVLEKTDYLDAASVEPIKDWFASYMEWLTTHPYGIDERDHGNNHSSSWALQVAAFARLLEDEEQLIDVRRMFKEELIPGQMAQNGSFPDEIDRTKPYGYSLFHMDVLGMLAQIASAPDDNLWTFELPDGRGMRRALAFITPYIVDKSKWPYPEDVMYYDAWPVRHPTLLFGGLALDEPSYVDMWMALDSDPVEEEVIRNYPVRQPLLWARDAR